MTPVRLIASLTTLALVAVACVDAPRVAGPSANRAPRFATTSVDGTTLTGRHIVSFRGTVPGDFAQRVAALGGTVLWTSPGTGLATVAGLTGTAPTTLAGSPGVQAVDADESLALDIPAVSDPDAADAAGVASPTNPAGAARFARQWNMKAVQADVAWAHQVFGSSNVSIFMLDTGIDYLHADLVGRVDLVRSLDLTGKFTVIVKGVPVVFSEADTVKKYFPTRKLFTDLFFHGTHTGATVSSNAVRAAGITSMTTLVAVKVCGYVNACPFSSILNGVIYAATNGADVINMSLGGFFTKAHNGRFAGLLNKTFNFARSKGVTIVVSAGNSAIDLQHIGNTYATFCATPAVICVSATGPLSDATANDPNVNLARTGPWTSVDAPAYFTNFGLGAIDVAAPGGNSSFGPPLAAPAGRDTFVWAACSQTSLRINCASLPTFIVGVQGTSMSAPHVSGTAALLVSVLGRNPAAIKARIEQAADEIGGNGEALFYGHGRLNVARAVGAIP
jgi:lantibiotic leader peptide-processing serine protease